MDSSPAPTPSPASVVDMTDHEFAQRRLAEIEQQEEEARVHHQEEHPGDLEDHGLKILGVCREGDEGIQQLVETTEHLSLTLNTHPVLHDVLAGVPSPSPDQDEGERPGLSRHDTDERTDEEEQEGQVEPEDDPPLRKRGVLVALDGGAHRNSVFCNLLTYHEYDGIVFPYGSTRWTEGGRETVDGQYALALVKAANALEQREYILAQLCKGKNVVVQSYVWSVVVDDMSRVQLDEAADHAKHAYGRMPVPDLQVVFYDGEPPNDRLPRLFPSLDLIANGPDAMDEVLKAIDVVKREAAELISFGDLP